MSDPVLVGAPTPAAAWTIQHRCCWCGQPFLLHTILEKPVWICATPTCFERQARWAMWDGEQRLFHLPLPKQVELNEAIESQRFRAICIGGSRGGGKSRELRHIAYRYCQQFESFNALLLRRTFPELEDNHLVHAPREARLLGGDDGTVKYTSRKVTFKANDSLLSFDHCADPNDYEKYIGPEYDLILFDQIEMFLDQQVREISAATGRILRPGWRGLVLAGENPGGPGAAMVDELFISKSRDRVKYPQYKPEQYHFIPSQVEDNPYIDPGYADFLGGLDAPRREQYRFGRRDVFPGQYFPDFHHPDRIQALDVSPDLPRIGGLHWGYFRPGMFLCAVLLPDGRLYVEWERPFEETLAATVGRETAEEIRRRKITLHSVWGNPPQDVPDEQSGEDVFETLRTAGLPVLRSDHARVTGWQRLRHWWPPLLVDGSPQLQLILSPACAITIKTLPQLIQDDTDPEDCDQTGPIAGAAALRYLVMSRPTKPEIPAPAVGRDLSTLPEKVRHDLERMRDYDAREADGDLKMGDRGWPFGEHWGNGSVMED